MSNPVCPVCDIESDVTWKCSECGKPFDGNESSQGGRAVLGGGA
jgi:tRNA(Ile2) C34 agmatinyltransferase TiaS